MSEDLPASPVELAAARRPPGEPDRSDAVDTAWAALGRVYDPELGMDVVSLGLVYEVVSVDGGVAIEMTLTTPGCPASESLPTMARIAVDEALGGAVPVDVHVVWDPPWNPTMMDDEAAAAFGFRAR